MYNIKRLNGKTDQTIIMSNTSFCGIIILLIITVMNTSKYGASLSWIVLPCILILFGWLLKAINNNVYIRKEHVGLLLFWMTFFISTAFSSIVDLQRDILTFLVLCLVLFCATSFSCSKKQLSNLVYIYIIIALFVEGNIIYNWLTHNYYVAWFKRASFSFMGVYRDPNYVMAFVLPSIALLFIKFVNEKKLFKKTCDAILLLIAITAVLASGSRAPMISFLIFVCIYFFSVSDMKLKTKITIVFCGVVVALIAVYLMKKYYPAQSLDRLLNTDDSRLDLWAAALNVFKKYPIIGGGMSAASLISNAIEGNDSHNVYIDILCNSGIVGSLCFAMYFYFSCLQTTKRNKAFIYSMTIAFMLPMFFVNGFNTATFYMPLIIMTLFSKYCQKNDSSYLDFLIKEEN